MGVPGFYSWLTKRYPLIKHMVGKHSLPQIDYLYLDMNGIIYKCVKDDSVIFKSQILPKQFEQIWIQVFNYINMIVNLLKPNKMIFLALDGVAPRSKMNNQRARRFKSARDYKQFIQVFYGYNQNVDSQQNFKNNSISPGTKFMQQLNQMIHFFIQKKIQQDQYWKNLSLIFTGSDSPGQGQHKIMQWIRSNKNQFQDTDCHCLYGADADLIMLGLTLPMKNVCIIREEYIHSNDKAKIKNSKKQKIVQFEMIFLSILREYFDVQYSTIKSQLKHVNYDVSKIIKDFVFLFFFIGNDFLPRCMAYNIRQRSIEKLISALKIFLIQAQDYVVGDKQINIKSLSRLCNEVAKYQSVFIQQKAQDADKFLQKKNQFQDEFTKVMNQKVIKQSQFLNQLKQFYMNQDQQSIRAGFYRDKFAVNPSEEVQEFYKILGFYLHGLKFVYEYYFLNLSSWSWYYPYYYAPLLSDLSFYLNYLAETGAKLNQLELGTPFEPFKQLLCILPKQSLDLLPNSFQKYLKQTDSPLRSPFDFYPDHFDDDLYGSTRSHEAISLIPFLDQQKIQNVYQTAIKDVSPEDIRRNVSRKTRLYQYDENASQIQVKSPLSVIESFSCNIKVTDIQLLKQCTWKNTKTKVPLNSTLLRMPTLTMKQHIAVIQLDKRGIRYLLQLIQPENKQIKLGNAVYYGYPLQHSGRIQAILTKDTLEVNPDFSPLNYLLDCMSRDYAETWMIQQRKKQLFQDLIDSFKKKQLNYLNLKNVQTLVFVKDTQYFSRALDGSFQRVYNLQNDSKTYQIIPLSMISKQRKYQTTKQDTRFLSLQQQFPKGDEVILAHPDQSLCGYKAKVIGYTNNKVKVQLTTQMKKIKGDKLFKMVNTDQVFLDIKFVSEIIGMKYDILLTILDSVLIQLPKQKNLPDSIDIGLNFINRQQNKIVPNLVRINFDKDHVKNQDARKKFRYLQLSVKAFQMLLEYKKKYPQVLDFIKFRHHKLIDDAKSNQKPINWRQKIRAVDIYLQDGQSQGKHQQITKNLMKVYLWLIKNKQTHMPMSSMYSKQISYKKIAKLEDYFKNQGKSKKNNNNNNKKNQQLIVDPNFLYSLQLSRRGSLYLSKKPSDHTIGDQIICLHAEHFGHFGVVVGVDDDRYEVIFDKPSFGKNDLGGLCSNLWGAKFRYKELLNIETWPQNFRQRQYNNKKILQNSGWIDCMNEFYPRFKGNPIKNFNDFELIIKNQTISKLFQKSTIDQVLKIKLNLKQVEIDRDYVVVDNAQQDYLYKFDKKQTTVSQKQVQDMAKNKKWIDKKLTDVKNQDFEKQIIQNKMAELNINEKQVIVIQQPKAVVKQTKKPEIQQVKSSINNNNNNNKKQKYVQKPIQVQVKSKVVDQNAQFGQQQDAQDILG